MTLNVTDAGEGAQTRLYEIAGYELDPESNGPLEAGRPRSPEGVPQAGDREAVTDDSSLGHPDTPSPGGRRQSAAFESMGPHDPAAGNEGAVSQALPPTGTQSRRSSEVASSVGRRDPAAGSEGAVDQARSASDDTISVGRLTRAVNERPMFARRDEDREVLKEAKRRAGLGGSRGSRGRSPTACRR